MTDTPNDGLKRNGLTYSDAGVDIDAGNLMVEKIKPLVRSTRRPGADTEIGGFGGLFDLKAAGFSDPILVSKAPSGALEWNAPSLAPDPTRNYDYEYR